MEIKGGKKTKYPEVVRRIMCSAQKWFVIFSKIKCKIIGSSRVLLGIPQTTISKGFF